MTAASQLSGIWKTLEAHNTEDILPGATDWVGIFPSPYSHCAYFAVEQVGIWVVWVGFWVFFFWWRNKNEKLDLFLTPRKSCFQVLELAKICLARLLKMCTFVFKIRILQSWSPTANDSFPLLARLCAHVSEGGEPGADQCPGTKKGKEGKGWRKIIYPVSRGTFFTGLGHFHLNSFCDERSTEGPRVAWASEHSPNSKRWVWQKSMI